MNLPIDLVIANAGGATVGTALFSRGIRRITNNHDNIAALTKCIDPKFTIPVHRGTFSHYQDFTDSTTYSDKRIVLPELGKDIVIDT